MQISISSYFIFSYATQKIINCVCFTQGERSGTVRRWSSTDTGEYGKSSIRRRKRSQTFIGSYIHKRNKNASGSDANHLEET